MKASFAKTCGICGSNQFDLLWDLPQLPLTEKFGPFQPAASLCMDQTLLFCEECAHVQLKKRMDPSLLYTPTEYIFRTAASKTAVEGTEFFHQFFLEAAQGRTFASLLDIGGNGLLLAKRTSQAQKRAVIDPVCRELHGQTVEGVTLYGGFIEDFPFEKEGLFPDLIFSRHVLEHIAEPKEVLARLLEKCSPNALYVLEIPCFDQLLEAGRFDAIFHQHYHYYTLRSLQRLFYEIGAEYVSHRHHPRGPCGGSLLIAFRKAQHPLLPPKAPSLGEEKKKILAAIRHYQAQMEALKFQLTHLGKPIYGYGAGLMLATLAYHLQTDFSELVCILDDDPSKDRLSYQNVPVEIRSTHSFAPPKASNYLITSLENVRPIYQKITSHLSPRRILTPLVH